MKNIFLLVFTFFITFTSFATAPYEVQFKVNDFYSCYAMANIGRDSVENNAAGLALEKNFNITLTEKEGQKYYPDTLSIIVEGYKWKCSSHEYGMRVMHNCSKGAYLATAQSTPLSIASYFPSSENTREDIIPSPVASSDCVYNIGVH